MEEKKKKSIFKRWWFWLIVIIVIIAIASSSSDTTTNPNGEIKTSTQATEKFTLVSDEMSTDGFGTTYIQGTITNNTNKTYSYVQVTFNLYDADGAQLGTAMDNINNLEPNGTWKYKALGLVSEKVASYKFVEITGW